MNKISLSIIIPCYEMGDKGSIFLKRSLDIISNQKDVDFSTFEIVISDHSINNEIEASCKLELYQKLNIKYIRNENDRGSMACNTNNCIQHSSGKYIKPLYQDDYLYSEKSIKWILENLQDYWIAHEYTHLNLSTGEFYNQRTPFYNYQMVEGINTIGPPSSIVFLNDDNYFDENLIWFIDTEFYYRMNKKYGLPTILKCNTPLGVVTTWDGQTTNTKITPELIDKEKSYVKMKHKQ